jgi:WD40 repeat protein
MSSPARRLPLVALALTLGPAARGEPPARTDLYGDPLPPGAVARLGTVRWRSADEIGGMAFLPDGKHLVTDSDTMSVWDLSTGRVVRTVGPRSLPPEGYFGGFDFTPGGKPVLSVSTSGGPWLGGPRKVRLLVWDFATGRVLARSPDLDERASCFALRKDGRLVACVNGGKVLLWGPGEIAFRPVAELRKGEVVYQLAFSPDGKHLLVAGCSATRGARVERLDIASGKLLKRVTFRPDNYNIIFAPDNRTAATYTYPGQLCLYDLSTGEKRPLPRKENVDYFSLSFSPDGRTLLAWDRWAETVYFWDVMKGQLTRRLRVPDLRRAFESAPLLLSPDGTTLASYERDRVLRLWDARTGQLRLRLPGHVHTPWHLAFSADGQEVVSYSGRPDPFGEVYRWQAATGKPLGSFALDAPMDNYLRGAVRERMAPGGRHLALQLHRSLHVFETRTGKRIDLSAPLTEGADWSFSPDGRSLVLTGPNRSVGLWDVTTGKLQRRLELEKKGGPITWLRFSPDGRTLATGDGGGKGQDVRLWDAATGQHRARLTLPQEVGAFWRAPEHWEIAFAPDGRYLFASNYQAVGAWDTVTRREAALVQPDEHAGGGGAAMGPVAVSPDGRLLTWCLSPGYLRLYEACTGRLVHRFADGEYWSVAFAPTGWRLATGCRADASVLVWDLPLLFRSQPLPDKDERPEALWDRMAADDAAEAHRALWRLAALPGADAFLARRLTGVERVPPERLRAMLADLGSPDFAKRKAAEEELAAAGEAARAALAEAAAGAKGPEVRRRLARLRARLRPPEAQRLRELRAVLVLEARGTPEARRLLETLARGAVEARLTQEAKAALRRLERRPAP